MGNDDVLDYLDFLTSLLKDSNFKVNFLIEYFHHILGIQDLESTTITVSEMKAKVFFLFLLALIEKFEEEKEKNFNPYDERQYNIDKSQ